MTIDRRALAAVLATVVLVAACGGSATQSPGGDAGARSDADAERHPERQGADAQEPGETPESTGPEVSLLPGGAADLEAKLPTEVNGVKFERTSFNGENFPGGLPIGDSDMEKFLAANGKTVNDVKVAIATAAESESAGTFVMAIQIKGVPSDKMLAWAADTMGQDTDQVDGRRQGGLRRRRGRHGRLPVRQGRHRLLRLRHRDEQHRGGPAPEASLT